MKKYLISILIGLLLIPGISFGDWKPDPEFWWADDFPIKASAHYKSKGVGYLEGIGLNCAWLIAKYYGEAVFEVRWDLQTWYYIHKEPAWRGRPYVSNATPGDSWGMGIQCHPDAEDTSSVWTVRIDVSARPIGDKYWFHCGYWITDVPIIRIEFKGDYVIFKKIE